MSESGSATGAVRLTAVPKIELHVHLEGTVRPATLLKLARRNDQPLPVSSPEGLAELYRFKDFSNFVTVWKLTTNVMRTRADFTQVVLDYAAEAAAHGAVYVEGIFSPGERIARGVDPDAIFSGYCEGAERASEEHGVRVRLAVDLYRGLPLDLAAEVARHASRYRERGVLGFGLGGDETAAPTADYAAAFAIAREGGLASVPHAGETVGPASVREALDVLGADRIRHGIRAADDPALTAELAERGIVLDVCPTSNLATGAVASIEDHPLPKLMAAGVACSISTDDPAIFDTDLNTEYELAATLGVSARAAYAAGIAGALCGEELKAGLRAIGEQADWRD